MGAENSGGEAMGFFREMTDLGGVTMWVVRDHVEGYVFYYHPRHPKHSLGRRGVFPYIGCRMAEGSTPYLRVSIRSRPGLGNYNSRVRLNAQGVVAERDRGINQLDYKSNIKGHSLRDYLEYYTPRISNTIQYIDMEVDGRWYAALGALRHARVAVVRFTQETDGGPSYYSDCAVSTGNKQLVDDVLTAYEALTGRPADVRIDPRASQPVGVPDPPRRLSPPPVSLAPPQQPSRSPHDGRVKTCGRCGKQLLATAKFCGGCGKPQPPVPMPQAPQERPAATHPEGTRVEHGPFSFYPDGTITSHDEGIRLSARSQFGEMTYQGYKLQSTPRGGIIVVHPDGSQFVGVEFRDGRVILTRLKPRGKS